MNHSLVAVRRGCQDDYGTKEPEDCVPLKMASSYKNLKMPAYVELNRSEAESRLSNLSPLFELKFNSDSEEYDTDLEINDDILLRTASVKRKDDLLVPRLRLTSSPTSDQKGWDDPVNRVYIQASKVVGLPIQPAVMAMLKENVLDLSHRPLTEKHLKVISIALENNNYIEEINLESVGMTSAGAAHLADTIIHNNGIVNVNMSQNRLSGVGAVSVGAMMRYSTGLLTLNAAGNAFSEKGAKYLVHGIKTNRIVEDLDLSRNDFGQNAAQLLGSALADNCGIKRLNMAWNHFRCSGAVSICKGLQRNHTLVSVNLAWNGFGYEGAVALKDVLFHNTTLEDIDVTNNRINWQGALIIAGGLKKNSTLKTLKMGHNPLTTTGCQDLIEACSEAKLSGLRMLDLEGVPVIREFEMMAMVIKGTKDFAYRHGGFVNSHDILGQRGDKKLDPMQKVIAYMKDREIRPTELFRSFDKEVSSSISHNNLIRRLKGVGVEMQRFEFVELIQHIEKQGNGGHAVNYKNLVRSVNDQHEKDRNTKILERESAKRLQEYHRYLLRSELPVVPEVFDNMPQISGMDSTRGDQADRSIQAASSAVRRIGTVASIVDSLKPKEPPVGSPKKVMSMARPLGSKPKAFGQAQPKKKKKKRKKACKSKK